MNFNIFLPRLGLDPDNFKNLLIEPEIDGENYIWHLEQRTDQRECPYCGCRNDIKINDYNTVRINSSSALLTKDIIYIKKPRFKCSNCGKTFTNKLYGIEVKSRMSDFMKREIKRSFYYSTSFSEIGNKFNLTRAHVMNLFDSMFPEVKRTGFPEYLCIDEIRFCKRIDEKFPVVLYNWENKLLVDMVKSRQGAYLREYLRAIPEGERNKVKVIISDMYDTYSTIKTQFFPKAIHVIDLFHVVQLLSNAVKQLRIRTMNALFDKKCIEYKFMKSNWKVFIQNQRQIKEKYLFTDERGRDVTTLDMVLECCKLNPDLYDGWSILQELLTYSHFQSSSEAQRFILRISERLQLSGSEMLKSVGRSYARWSNEIANGFAYYIDKRRFSNGVAEGGNNKLKTIKKVANGYVNFPRFRKRCLLVVTYSKIVL